MSGFLNFVRSRTRLAHRPSLATMLVGPRVILRVGDVADWKSWRAIREGSEAFLKPWEPLWPQDALSYDRFLAQTHRHWREWKEGRAYAFQICLKDEKQMHSTHANDPWLIDDKTDRTRIKDYAHLPVIGGVALNDVTRGIAYKATLGYWLGEAFAGQGLMSEAVTLASRFSFEVLNLHRLEASCIPYNEPSKRLLARQGFIREGVAHDYLKINGQWADHLLWGKVNNQP